MKKIAFFVMVATLLFAGCEKDWWQIFRNDDDEGFAIKEVPCEVDLGGVSTDGLTVMSSVGGFACGGDTSSLSVVDTSSPQMVMVLDDNENVLGLYRGLMYEGRPVSVTVHSTALAMVTSNPALAVYADGMLDALEQSVVSDPAFAELERQVGAAIGAGRDIFDTTNTAMRTAFDTVMQHIFGEDPDAEAKGVEDALPFVDHTPLRAEKIDGCLCLSNYCLVPTYYGTVTYENGNSTELVIPCREDYTLGSIVYQNILHHNHIQYGEQVYVVLNMGNNSIELSNWESGRAKTTFVLSMVNDGLRIIGVPFTGNQKNEFVIMGISYVTDAIASCTTAGIKEITMATWRALWGFVKTKGTEMISESALNAIQAQWAKKTLEIGVNKVIAWYNLTLGVGNGATRLYDFLRYPHDLSFCVNVSNVSEGKAIEWGECKSGNYFSVSDTKKVLFAPGNLDYNGGYFFTAHQYDYGGYFGWGTGSNPTDTSTDGHDYPTFDDWGNHIAGGWRTLTADEWFYVTFDRADAAAKCGAATVCGAHGIVLLPDNFSGGTFNAGFDYHHEGWSRNVYDASSWSDMEDAGAVFLPAAGGRYGTELVDVGTHGIYWSSTPYYGYDYDYYAHLMHFYVGVVDHSVGDRCCGLSVRLVQDY